MTALNFKEEFAGAVERAEKTQTIRRVRKTPIKVGDTLQLFADNGFSSFRHIGWGVVRSVEKIKIRRAGVHIPPQSLSEMNLNGFAKADGFKDWPEMRDWFEGQYGLPFEGVLIRWKLEERG